MLVIVTSHPIQYQAPLWRALAAAGVNFEVWFLTPHAVAPSLDRQFGRTFAWDVDLLSGYSHRFLPIRPGWRLDRFCGVRLADNWASMLRTRGVTHLWIEGWRFATLWRAAHAADRLGLELWLRGETTDLKPERGPRAFARRLALRWLFRRVDQFLHIGTANHRFYAGCGVPDAKLHHAPYCVDNEHFAAQAEYFRPQRGALRARWGIPNDAWTVLFCGKLINKKRPLDLIEAAAMAQPKASRAIHLLFAGDGELAPAVRALLARTGVPGTVTGFLNQSQVPAAYAAADCLVLPSDHNETWGLVANEALASGLGIIVSDQCGCAEDLAAPLGPAHVYRCGDPRALASALLHCTERPIDPEVIRLAAASHHIRHTVGTVQSILGRQSRP